MYKSHLTGVVLANILSLLFAEPLLIGEAQAAMITDGSFEDNPFADTGFHTGSSGLTIGGWTIGGNGVHYAHSSYWQAANGDWSVDLNNDDIGSVLQTVTGLVSGETYRIDFKLSGNPDGFGSMNTVIKELEVSINSQTFGFTYDVTGNTRSTMNYADSSFIFTYEGGMGDDLKFENINAGPWGAVIDDVSISTVVPLPAASWLFGCSLLGLIGMARRKTA